MTIEEKAKAYDRALERAREFANDLPNGRNDRLYHVWDLESIFPELAESEDEKMRKELLGFIKNWKNPNNLNCPQDYPMFTKNEEQCDKYIAWLEKQNEPQDKGEISDGYHTFNELYYYRMLYNAAFFNMLPKEWVHKSKKHHDGEECFGGGWFIVMANLPTGQISNHYELKDWDLFQIPEKEVADKWDGHTPQEAADRLHKYLLEKQGEHKPVISDDALREGIAHYGITQYQIDNWMKKYVDVEKQVEPKQHFELKAGHWYICHRAFCCRADHLTVKEGERFMCEEDGVVKGFVIKDPEKYFIEISMPADNLEPKFKVGDWIVYYTEEWSEVLMVDRVDDGIYHLVDVNGETCNAFFEEECNMRLWGIGDAKDGDVLVFDDIIMIFKNIKTVCTANTYILYCNGDGIVVDDWCDFGPDARPATKEQRDFLFSKIKEAGYELGTDKKELKKIEQKQELSEEEINSLLSNLDSNIKEFVMTDEFENEIGGHYWAIAKHAFLLGLGSNLSNTRMELKKIEQKPTLSEDERIRKNCIHFLELQKEHHAATFEIEECIDWLKSLRSQNQYDKGFNDGYSAAKYNQWKPSEKQMEAIKFCCSNFEEYDALQSLYNDLKNL